MSAAAPASPIAKMGGPPPQFDSLSQIERLNEEELLLRAGWAYGLSTDDIVHRYSLFALIQTHLVRKSEQPLQRAIESSLNWVRVRKGSYKLSAPGGVRMNGRFGISPPKSNTAAAWKLTRFFEGHEFAIDVSPRWENLQVYVDRTLTKGVEAYRQLLPLGAVFDVRTGPETTRIWNWIVAGEFRWERLY